MTSNDLTQPLEYWDSSPNPASQTACEKGKLNWLDFPVAPEKIPKLTMTLGAISSLSPLVQTHLAKREEMAN